MRKEEENQVTIYEISKLELIYIFVENEVIDITNAKNKKHFIYKSQVFSINLSQQQMAFLITPSETVEEGKIHFYNGESEYKSRELENDTTSFYIEKQNDTNNAYFVKITTNNFIVYEFNLLENFEIIDENKSITIPTMSTKYFLFPYKDTRDLNNDYYYGLEDFKYFENNLYLELLIESKKFIDFPSSPFLDYVLLLQKNHFILRIISKNKKNLNIKAYYSKKVLNNIKIYNSKNPEFKKIFNNKGVIAEKNIKQFYLIYDCEELLQIYFHLFSGSGEMGVFDYQKRITIKDNLDLKDFKKDSSLFYELNYDIKEEDDYDDEFNPSGIDYNYIKKRTNFTIFYLNVEIGSYYQTNILLYNEEPKIEDKNFIIYDTVNITLDNDVAISFSPIYFDYYSLKYSNLEIYRYDDQSDYEIFFGEYIFFNKNETLELKGYNDIIVHFTKKYSNDNFLMKSLITIESSQLKWYKITLPYIKKDYKFYEGFGIVDDTDFYINNFTEHNFNFNSNKKVRFYFQQIVPCFSNAIIYAMNKSYYQDTDLDTIEIESLPDKIVAKSADLYSEDENFFEYFKTAQFYSCKGGISKIFIGNGNNISESQEVKDSCFLDFSLFSSDCSIEIETNNQFLLFINQKKDQRKNKNIIFIDRFTDKKLDNYIFNKTDFYISVEEPIIKDISYKKYFIAEYNEKNWINLQNECYLYTIYKESIKTIIIPSSLLPYTINKVDGIYYTDYNNFKEALNKECKKYILTIIAKPRYLDDSLYFYNPVIFEVTQSLLDEDDSKDITSGNLFYIIGAILLLISFILQRCFRKKRNNIEENNNLLNRNEINAINEI